MIRFLFILLCLPLTGLFAQSSGLIVIKTKQGLLLVYNGEGENFTFELRGDSVKSLPESMFAADGYIIQPRTFPANPGYRKYLTHTPTGNDYIDICRGYMAYELGWVEKQYQTPVAHRDTLFTTLSGRPWILWEYDTPESALQAELTGDPILRNFFLTTLINTTLLTINLPQFPMHGYASMVQKGKSIASTLNVYGGRIETEILANRFGTKAKEGLYVLNNCGYGMILPTWFNVCDFIDGRLTGGTFPEDNLEVPALTLVCYAKKEFESFTQFNTWFILGNRKDSVSLFNPDLVWLDAEMKPSLPNINGINYKVRVRIKGVEFTCRYVTMETTEGYVLVNFTAGEASYAKNEKLLEEFLGGISVR